MGAKWVEIGKLLSEIYGEERADDLVKQVKDLVKRSDAKKFEFEPNGVSDLALITYANSIEDEKRKQKPLAVLKEFLANFQINKVINTLHILPFYPWDADRGFSITDYYKVEARYGSWGDIAELGEKFRLMFDFVLNHASIENPLVQNALIERHLSKSSPEYKKYRKFKDFVIAYSDKDKPSPNLLKKLVRPRVTPVLTKYLVFKDSKGKIKAVLGDAAMLNPGLEILGKGWVWTTFSRPKTRQGKENTRQVDLNYANPRLFLEIIRLFIFYIRKGAGWVRLDAAGMIWKKLGSTSVYEKEARILVKILKEIGTILNENLKTVAEAKSNPKVMAQYIDEDDVSIIYQFGHYPLSVYSILTESGVEYAHWLESTNIFAGHQFIPVLGTHDGLSLKAIRNILGEEKVRELALTLKQKHGGLINYAIDSSGKKILSEVCATAWSMVNKNTGDNFKVKLNRYLAVLSLGLLIKGSPAVYINSLFGAKNYIPKEGLDENRTINREIFYKSELFSKLKDIDGREHIIMRNVLKRLSIWSRNPAFAPNARPLRVIEAKNKSLIIVLLESKDGEEKVVSITNVSSKPQQPDLVGLYDLHKIESLKDLITGEEWRTGKSSRKIKLSPYQVIWGKISE